MLELCKEAVKESGGVHLDWPRLAPLHWCMVCMLSDICTCPVPHNPPPLPPSPPVVALGVYPWSQWGKLRIGHIGTLVGFVYKNLQNANFSLFCGYSKFQDIQWKSVWFLLVPLSRVNIGVGASHVATRNCYLWMFYHWLVDNVIMRLYACTSL